MVGQLTIKVLGELNVTQQGQLLPLPQSKKTRALLAYLAVVGRAQRREHLCKMFWEVPDDPRASLRWSLHKLRPIVNTEGHVRLHADHNSVLAYAVCGRGSPIVRAAHWMSHLQYDWESPVWTHWIDALSEKTKLIRYDERGTGLSDWIAEDISFAAMIADLESVVDAAGLDRFTLLGVSQSCAVSVAYAVRHPERVSGLILYGGFVKGWRKRSDSHEVATHEAMTALIREGWGQNNPVFRHLFTAMFIPGANQVQMDWFDELQRISVLPSNAGRLHEAFGEIDVSDVLSQVTIPTLVLHARKDTVVPFQCGREFATGIPGARFVDLDSANHILLANEPAFERFVREVTRFVAETA